MGIDAEDGGVGGHGPISTYVDVVNDILSNVTNGNSGILVIGGENDGGSGDVTEFWDRIEADTGEPVTYVRGATNIQNQDFSGFAMLGVVSSHPETFDGMSQAENDALVNRSSDVASVVDNGGGLLGTSQTDFSNAWAYIADIGSFTTITNQSIDDVTPTSAGNDIGIHDPDLDICCWHDTFTAWPSFLEVLAWEAGEEDEEAVALGGARVTLQAPSAECSMDFPGSDPAVGETITFDGSGSTDPDGDDSALTYEWDFDGDGTTDATGQTVQHTFSSSGQKTVVLTVTDADGKSSTCELSFDVKTSNRPPVAECEVSFPGEVPATGETITFDASASSDPDGDPLTYAWDFDGDGTTDATGAVVDHTFTTAGEHTVTVTVTDDKGASDTCEQTLNVWIGATIDIKPCSDPNAFNPDGGGVVPVGIKQTSTFDPASEIAVDTLRFGAPDVVMGGDGSTAAHDGHVEDVVPCEGDGMDDLVVHFPVEDTGFDGDEDMGRLEGETQDGTPLVGEDSVKLAGGGGGSGGGNPGGGGPGGGSA